MARDIKGVIIWAGTETNLAIISCEWCTIELKRSTGSLTDLSKTACLPMMRPIFKHVVRGSILDSGSNTTGPNPISGLTSSKGIKLTNITRTKDLDDNSSQQQLADAEDGSSGDMDFNYHNDRVGNNNTIITSCAEEAPNSSSNTAGLSGIQVKNETRVYYETTRNTR
jgi:hypothetical protein